MKISKRTIWTKGSISLLLFAPAVCCAATTIRLAFPTEILRTVWVLPQLPTKLPENGSEYTSKNFELQIPDSLLSGVILVGEPSTGNYAYKKVQELLKKGTWTVLDTDYLIGRVAVNVSKNGAPADGVMVTLSRGDSRKRELTVQGEANFYFISPGQAEIFATYSDGKQTHDTRVQRVEFSMMREEPIPNLVIELPPEAVVGNPSAQAKPAAPPPKLRAEGGFAWMNLIYYLIALIIAAFALWYLFKLAKQNDTKLVEQLRNLGVDPGGGGDSQPQAAQQAKPLEPEPLVPAGHCLFCGEAFDASGGCACSGKKTPAPTAAVGTRFVSSTGQAFEIPMGTTVIGREGAIAISDATVSRRHAEIRRDGSRTIIVDLGSANGTFVNGMRIDSETELHNGDTVQFGAFQVRFEP